MKVKQLLQLGSGITALVLSFAASGSSMDPVTPEATYRAEGTPTTPATTATAETTRAEAVTLDEVTVDTKVLATDTWTQGATETGALTVTFTSKIDAGTTVVATGRVVDTTTTGVTDTEDTLTFTSTEATK